MEIFVYIYIEIKFDFNLERDKIANFYKKLRLNWDKLKQKDQIETKEMTPGIILTRVTITTTSLCHYHVARWQLDTWHFFDFFKKIQKKN